MEERIKDLVDFTREKYGLAEYDLHTWDICRHKTIFKDTVYTLSMEWFPNHEKDWEDEGCNPKGTAFIEIDIHTRKVKKIIFVGGISYTDSMTFDCNDNAEIIKWIEKEAGLKYGQQFEFWKEKGRVLHFRGCIDGVAVSPSVYIELRLDEAGKLTLFSIYGQFPNESLVKHEEYVLSIDQIEERAKKQLTLVEFPVEKKKKLVSVYAIEEIYIKNDCSSTIPFEFIVDVKAYLQINKEIEWDHQIKKPFHKKELSLDEEITPEQAFQCEPHPDLQPITEDEIPKCIEAIQKFLSQEYTNDSGRWVLKSLHRDKGYIQAILKAKEQKERAFNRKLKLFIDSKTYEALNYTDNEPLLDIYKDLTAAEEIKVTNEEAYEKLKDMMELKPYYVYDFEQGYYVLCGKLDCHYAVKASSGEVVEVSELE